jgi:hypothetical protein
VINTVRTDLDGPLDTIDLANDALQGDDDSAVGANEKRRGLTDLEGLDGTSGILHDHIISHIADENTISSSGKS